jgi:hypothetical protein
MIVEPRKRSCSDRTAGRHANCCKIRHETHRSRLVFLSLFYPAPFITLRIEAYVLCVKWK